MDRWVLAALLGLAATAASAADHLLEPQKPVRTLREALRGRDLTGLNDSALDSRVPAPAPGRRYATLSIHVNPSAQRLFVFASDSRLVAELGGWHLAVLPDESIVYHRNQVHFAPTHALEVAVFDPRSGADRLVYPPREAGPARRVFAARVAEIYRTRGDAWFRERNHHMDPTRFDTTLTSEVAVNDASMRFTVRFGDPDNARDPLPFSATVAVTCSPLRPVERIECRESLRR